MGAVFAVGEDVEVAVEGDGASEEVGEDFLVEGGAEGEVGAWELFEISVYSVGECAPGFGFVIGDVQNRELGVVEGSEAEGVVVVVGFDVDDGALIGWVADGFGVFVESVRLVHMFSPQGHSDCISGINCRY